MSKFKVDDIVEMDGQAQVNRYRVVGTFDHDGDEWVWLVREDRIWGPFTVRASKVFYPIRALMSGDSWRYKGGSGFGEVKILAVTAGWVIYKGVEDVMNYSRARPIEDFRETFE